MSVSAEIPRPIRDSALPGRDVRRSAGVGTLQPDRRAALLARLLVEFDPLLADEVREHLRARADEWDPPASDPPAPAKVERAERYRSLAGAGRLRRRGPHRQPLTVVGTRRASRG